MDPPDRPLSWDEVVIRREELKRGRNQRRPASARPEYLLTGLLVCGGCGKNLVHKPQRQTRAGLHVCPDGGHFSRPCTGGGIGTYRAEELVVRMFRKRFWFAFGDDERLRHERLTSLESRWDAASIPERRQMLALTISRVELIPREPDKRYGRGARRGRELHIVWADGWDGLVDGKGGSVAGRHRDGMKFCNDCGLDKPLTEVESDASRWDGRTSRCKTCRRQVKSRYKDRDNLPRSKTRRKISHQEEWRLFLCRSSERGRYLLRSHPHRQRARSQALATGPGQPRADATNPVRRGPSRRIQRQTEANPGHRGAIRR